MALNPHRTLQVTLVSVVGATGIVGGSWESRLESLGRSTAPSSGSTTLEQFARNVFAPAFAQA